MITLMGKLVKGGAAIAVSPEGDIRLVFDLDRSWITEVQQHIPFDPILSALRFEISVIAGHDTSTFGVDRRTWPTNQTEFASSIRLKHIGTIDTLHNLSERDDEEPDPKAWKAKCLIGKEWQEDEKELERGTGVNVMLNNEQQGPEGSTSARAPDHVIDAGSKGKRFADDLNQTPDKKQKTGKKITNTELGDDDSASAQKLALCNSTTARTYENDTGDIGQGGSILQPELFNDTRQPHEFIDPEDKLIWCRLTDGSRFSVKVRANTEGSTITAIIANVSKTRVCEMRMVADRHRYWPGDWSVQNMGLWSDLSPVGTIAKENERYVEVHMVQTAGKPVIYLYPPKPTSIDITLSLCPQWQISASYPPASTVKQKPKPTETGMNWERIKWRVDAQCDGSMVDKATGLRTSYLFWEANMSNCHGIDLSNLITRTNHTTKPSKEDSFLRRTRSNRLERFEPSYTRLYPDQTNVVVVKSSDLSMYLDRALTALGLHVEARTSFITYWLPEYQCHQYIALTFLSQSLYNRTAPLDITPMPDIVTRVFMLHQRVDKTDLHLWGTAINKAEDDVAFWRKVVGVVDREMQEDKSLFRVLEWGGMEIR